eukprot:10688881-Alexandrium_andersonii.AAC.1
MGGRGRALGLGGTYACASQHASNARLHASNPGDRNARAWPPCTRKTQGALGAHGGQPSPSELANIPLQSRAPGG